jgi:hypothetical protein
MNQVETYVKQIAALMRAATSEARLTSSFHRLVAKAGYDPSQPRQPPGRPDGGQWAATRSAEIDRIIAAARLIKAGYSDRYSRCVDLCYPLLERLQPAGSDFNLWDYHKCLRACLNR